MAMTARFSRFFWQSVLACWALGGLGAADLPRLGWHWEPIEPPEVRARLAEQLAPLPTAVRSGPYRRMHDLPSDIVWWPGAHAFRPED